jgi:catechol 2,3-dioxygenase-like lactoylglutathione lyase family enzyme
MRLDHVQLAAPPGCEAAARAFYGGLLGLPEIDKPEPMRAGGGVWFALDGQELHIGVEAEFAPARKAHPGLSVDGDAALDALAARLAQAGAPVEWDDRYPGLRRFFTADPFGNRVELLAGAG